MYCHCHLDESSPHVYIGIVSVTSDGRLSANSLFRPKTLEKLQTDFNREVAQYYGLERGEYHAKKYLPLQQFKAKQAQIKAQKFSNDLDSAILQQIKINEIQQTVHFATNAFFFNDKDNVELPTQHFLTETAPRKPPDSAVEIACNRISALVWNKILYLQREKLRSKGDLQKALKALYPINFQSV